MDAKKTHVLADRLWSAQWDKKSIAPLTAEFPQLTIEDAYRISETNLNRRIKEKGTTLAGKKIGLTSKAIQSWLKVDQPDFGHLTSDMDFSQSKHIPYAPFLQPRIEAEIAFFLKKDLEAPIDDIAHVLEATETVAPALEIIDSRIQDWKIQIQDTVADNASSGAYVIGDARVVPSKLDMPILGMKMAKNGKIVSTGAGAACLGHPATAVAWLANAMERFGVTLKAGEVILSGALGPATDVAPNDEIIAFINGLGKVSCRFN